MIPLYSINEDKLISLSGDESRFFKVIPPDLEQMSEEQRAQSYQRLETDLKLAEFGKCFKAYFKNGLCYLNAGETASLGDCGLIPDPNPLEAFFGTGLYSNIEFHPSYLTLNGKFLRVISLTRAPQEIMPNLLQEMTEGLCSFVLHLKRMETAEAKKKLNLRRKMHFSGLFKSLKDIESENAYSESEGLLEGVTKGDVGLFKMECFFIVETLSLSDLDSQTNTLMERLKNFDAKAIIEAGALPVIYRSMIMGVPPLFHREIEVPSDYLSYLIPYHQDALMNEGAILNSLRGDEIKFDLFQRGAHNYNLLITGPSGQGKSMMANKLIYEQIKVGSKILCLDLGNSFRKNALYHDGTIFSETFNPLEFRCPRYLKEFIVACMEETLSRKEEGKLFEAIVKALEYNPQNFDELISLLSSDLPEIHHYFSEIKDFFTDEIRAESSFTYCDFSLYPEAIKAPLIIYLIEYFKRLSGRKVFVIDECWHLLSKNADYIAESFRTFRKHDASAIAISQNLDDLSQTQLGRVIIQNTFFKFFFRQNLELDQFIDLDLSERVKVLQSIKGEYSQFLIFSENIRKTACYYPTPLEYELFTSDKVDMNHFEHYHDEGGKYLDFQRAIMNFTELKYPHWRHYENSH
jgi:hypothetical protein